MSRCVAACGFVVLAVPLAALGQYFNIDVNNAEGLTPTPGFGAAAHQPGYWNRFDGVPVALRDLLGQPTNVMLIMAEEDGLDLGSGFGWDNFSGNTGNYARLLNDFAQIGTIMDGGKFSFTFTGLESGDYRVITYGVDPFADQSRTPVFVEGSQSKNPQVITGPMPGNASVLGVTHSRHRVSVVDGTIRIVIDVPPNGDCPADINGFQLAPVPAPATIAIGSGALIAAARRRRVGSLNRGRAPRSS